ncbi:hypothetical protein FN846DRAFT_262835 [Sphaerosporella brunnea]|uniref:Uncharacterized protein n=1 Tax=Sphaerosporella brunnea TaxID=1250544 RepID=A0A5J5ENB5_9PEZI|nr:hypothetical protein FN846DRAFT_262835 [Sphaerosporella brunnea]
MEHDIIKPLSNGVCCNLMVWGLRTSSRVRACRPIVSRLKVGSPFKVQNQGSRIFLRNHQPQRPPNRRLGFQKALSSSKSIQRYLETQGRAPLNNTYIPTVRLRLTNMVWWMGIRVLEVFSFAGAVAAAIPLASFSPHFCLFFELTTDDRHGSWHELSSPLASPPMISPSTAPISHVNDQRAWKEP